MWYLINFYLSVVGNFNYLNHIPVYTQTCTYILYTCICYTVVQFYGNIVIYQVVIYVYIFCFIQLLLICQRILMSIYISGMNLASVLLVISTYIMGMKVAPASQGCFRDILREQTFKYVEKGRLQRHNVPMIADTIFTKDLLL